MDKAEVFVVLECQQNYHDGLYVYKGIVLWREGKNRDEIYFGSLMDNDAKTKCYQPGDIVEAELIRNNYSPDKEPDYSDFIINKIRLIDKLSWRKLR